MSRRASTHMPAHPSTHRSRHGPLTRARRHRSGSARLSSTPRPAAPRRVLAGPGRCARYLYCCAYILPRRRNAGSWSRACCRRNPRTRENPSHEHVCYRDPFFLRWSGAGAFDSWRSRWQKESQIATIHIFLGLAAHLKAWPKAGNALGWGPSDHSTLPHGSPRSLDPME